MNQEKEIPALDFRLLFESAPNYLVLTPDLRIIAVSNGYLRATMTERAAIVGRGIFDVFPDNPHDRQATGVGNLRDSLNRVLHARQPDTMAVQKYDIQRPDGGGFEERHWSPVNTPVLSPQGDVLYIIHKVEDVTEFVRLSQAGKEQHQINEALRTHAGQMESEIYLRSQQLGAANRQLRSVNDGLTRLYEQVAGLMSGNPAAGKGPGNVAPDSLTPEDTLERVGQLITAHNHLEEQLRQAQKMEAVGRLAGGVAHDFNNLLTVISGYASFAQEQVAGSPAMHSLKEIENAAARASALTAQLLAFSRKQVLQPRVLECNVVVKEMENMLRRLITENISLMTVSGSGSAKINADRTQLEQVILNLVINARDAMPAGGRLVIETGTADLESDGQVPQLAGGRYVVIRVTDTGHGMDAATASQIFEPFFTTKERGKGTGLGLSTVQWIAAQSGGTVTVESVPGRGTTFRVYFPRLEKVTEDVAEVQSAPAAQPAKLGEVLIVEDEKALRGLIAQVIADAGYLVYEAANGDEALGVARAHAVQLLLTDVIMPGMSGPELADQIGRLRPEIMVLYMSGYDDEKVAAQIAAGASFLQKPFTPRTLLAKLSEIAVRMPQSRTRKSSVA